MHINVKALNRLVDWSFDRLLLPPRGGNYILIIKRAQHVSVCLDTCDYY